MRVGRTCCALSVPRNIFVCVNCARGTGSSSGASGAWITQRLRSGQKGPQLQHCFFFWQDESQVSACTHASPCRLLVHQTLIDTKCSIESEMTSHTFALRNQGTNAARPSPFLRDNTDSTRLLRRRCRLAIDDIVILPHTDQPCPIRQVHGTTSFNLFSRYNRIRPKSVRTLVHPAGRWLPTYC